MGVIYKITNTVTGKCYIGETIEKDPNKRYNAHMKLIRKGKGCPALRDAVLKHGEENFKFEVLITCPDEDRFSLEKEYIQKYNSIVPNGYNILEGGQCGGGFKGKTHTQESRDKISKMVKKHFEDPAELLAHSQRLKKLYENPENRTKASIALKASEKFKQAVAEGRVGGSAHTSLPHEEVKKKISEGLKKYFEKNDDTKPNLNIEKHRESMGKAIGKPISQYDVDGTFIKTYKTASEAARELGKPTAGGIRFAISGKYKTAYGFVWKYVVENP